MSEGIALTDADREGWLTTLGQLLQAHPQGVVLTCSAQPKAYRDRLRTLPPRCALRFWRLAALRREVRVKARAQTHFFFCRVGGKPIRHAGVSGGRAWRADPDAGLPLFTLAQQTCAWRFALQEVA